MFESVEITWKGDNFRVPPKKVMGLIAAIEEHITLSVLMEPEKIKNTSIAGAYAAAVNYAGGEADAGDVYTALFDGEGQSMADILGAITSIMIPPSARRAESEKKPRKAAKKKSAAS